MRNQTAGAGRPAPTVLYLPGNIPAYLSQFSGKIPLPGRNAGIPESFPVEGNAANLPSYRKSIARQAGEKRQPSIYPSFADYDRRNPFDATMKEGNEPDGIQAGDQALLLRLAAGHEPAFRQVYDRYWKMVYRTAERFLASDILAQDVVQEVFSTIWVHRTEAAAIGNLEAYLKTVAKNKIYSELRKWSRERKNQEAYLGGSEVSVANGDFALLEDENEQRLAEVLELLPPRQREVFLLARQEGLSHEKIAERLNVSAGTVKNHMVRALQSIRQQMAPHLHTLLGVFLP